MSKSEIYKALYRVFAFGSFTGLVITLTLLLSKPAPPTVPNDPRAATRAEQKFAAADQAKAAGQPAQVQLDRTELNSYLQQNLQTANSPQPAAGATPGPAASADPASALNSSDLQTIEQAESAVKDVKVDMDGDLVKAFVTYDVHGRDVPVELDGHISAENGYLKFDPVGGKIGSLPLPQSVLEAAVSKMMASPEGREKMKLPDDINDIQIQNGQAVVSYK